MDWEKQKYILDLELKKLELRKEKILKWISFTQTSFLLSFSATVSVLYKHGGKVDLWFLAGSLLSLLLLLDLLLNLWRIDRLEREIEKIQEKCK